MSEKNKTIQKNHSVERPDRRQLIQLAAMASLGVSMGVSTASHAQTAATKKKVDKVVEKDSDAKKKKKLTEAELAADQLKKGKVIDLPKP